MWHIKNFAKYFMSHQYMPKIFHDSDKSPPAPSPTYLMCGPLIEIMRRKNDKRWDVSLTQHYVHGKIKVNPWLVFSNKLVHETSTQKGSLNVSGLQARFSGGFWEKTW